MSIELSLLRVIASVGNSGLLQIRRILSKNALGQIVLKV